MFGCASTGNLAGSVAAHAARLGLPCYVFIPDNLEPTRCWARRSTARRWLPWTATTTTSNRLCTQIADRYGWGFANINLRSYYAEGAKRMGFEIVEQLGWRYPESHRVAGGGRTLLPRIYRAARVQGSWSGGGDLPKIYAAQPDGCAPVVGRSTPAWRFPNRCKPDTIRKSLAIGNPADGFQVMKVVNETWRLRRDGHATPRSSTGSSSWRGLKAFSPSRPAAPRWRPRATHAARCHQVARVRRDLRRG